MKIELFLCTLYFGLSYTVLDTNLIRGYMKFNSLSVMNIYSCLQAKEIITLIKELGTETRNRFYKINDDVSFLRLSVNDRHLAMILDGDCENIPEVYEKVGVFNDTHHWLVITEHKERALKLLGESPLNVDADVTLAHVCNYSSVHIYDVYNQAYDHGGEMKVEEIGNFSLEGEYNVKIKGGKYWNRRNMTGVTFRSAVVIPRLNTNLNDYLASDEHREINSQNRFQAVTVRHCRDMFNFTLIVDRTDSWGYMQSYGHFNGLVGLLERREIDFGSSPLLYKLDRMPVVGYSFGNWILKSTFIYRRPKTTQTSHALFLQPLSGTVWYILIVSIALIVSTMHFSCGIEKTILKKFRKFFERSWSNLILFVVATLCQQGFEMNLSLTSNRIACITVLLHSLLVYQFYSANIVSLLLRVPPRAINTIEDLKDSNLRLGVEDIAIDRAFFAETSYAVAKDMYETKIKNSNNNSGFYDPEVGLELVKKGGFAFHVETSTAYPIIEKTFTDKQICDLEEVQMYRTQPMHTNLQKGSPFKEMMTYCMMRLVEQGQMYRLRRHWDFRKPECLNTASGLHPVGSSEFSFALAILGAGICASVFVLVLEIFECKMNMKGPKRKNIDSDHVVYPFTN